MSRKTILNPHDRPRSRNRPTPLAEGLASGADQRALLAELKKCAEAAGYAPNNAALSYVEDKINAILEAIIKIGKPAVPDLLKALKRADYSLRLPLIYALGEIGDTQAIEPLGKLLSKKEHPDIHKAAAKALVKIKDMSQTFKELKVLLKEAEETCHSEGSEGEFTGGFLMTPIYTGPTNQAVESFHKAFDIIQELARSEDARILSQLLSILSDSRVSKTFTFIVTNPYYIRNAERPTKDELDEFCKSIRIKLV